VIDRLRRLLFDAAAGRCRQIRKRIGFAGLGCRRWPEHALLLAAGRVRYESATDEEALAAVKECCESEGILPALESAHALAGAKRWAQTHRTRTVLIGLSGRGDKDMPTLSQTLIARLENDK
jgi:tryptophan synthase beta chain